MRATDYLDRVADALELKGFLKEAYEVDLLANTIDALTQYVNPDLMTQYKKPDQRERNEEFNYAMINVRDNPVAAKQELVRYWGSEWGNTLYEIARRQLAAGNVQDFFPQWQRATAQAKQDNTQKAQTSIKSEEDPFLSPEEMVRSRNPAQIQPDPYFRR